MQVIGNVLEIPRVVCLLIDVGATLMINIFLDRSKNDSHF